MSAYHRSVWTLMGIKLRDELPHRQDWEWRDDYAGGVLDGLFIPWSSEHQAWVVRTLDAQLDRFLYGIQVMLGKDLRSMRATIRKQWLELIAINGEPGHDMYFRPSAGNQAPRMGVGEAVELTCRGFTQNIGNYLNLEDEQWGATLWWSQLLTRHGHLTRKVKCSGSYQEVAREKRLLKPGTKNRIPADEVVAASPVQLSTNRKNMDTVRWSETSGSRIVFTPDNRTLITSAPEDGALESISLHVAVQAICNALEIQLVQQPSTIGDLRHAKGVALNGSWTKWVPVQGMLVGQDRRVTYTEAERLKAPCLLTGEKPRELDVDFGTAQSPLITQIGEEYNRLLAGTSTLDLPPGLIQLVRPKA